jgi:hypothetical protein
MGRLSRHEFATFKNPTTGEPETATVLDEIWTIEPERLPEMCPADDDGWLEGVFAAQLLEWPNGGPRSVRICYWTRRPGRGHDGWVFAQYAPSMSLEQCRTIVDGIRERGWLERANIASSPR